MFLILGALRRWISKVTKVNFTEHHLTNRGKGCVPTLRASIKQTLPHLARMSRMSLLVRKGKANYITQFIYS